MLLLPTVRWFVLLQSNPWPMYGVRPDELRWRLNAWGQQQPALKDCFPDPCGHYQNESHCVFQKWLANNSQLEVEGVAQLIKHRPLRLSFVHREKQAIASTRTQEVDQRPAKTIRSTAQY